MPYTPPTQQSPAPSKPNSPILSRNHSYSAESGPPTVKNSRPALPRSVSSTSYLNKHRRTPSITTQRDTSNGHALHRSNSSSTNGAVTTPPDSSDDEERGRAIGDLKQLHQALQQIDLERGQSPDGREQLAIVTSRPGGLTATARKISHSRSASEITLTKHAESLLAGPAISSSEGSDAEDDGLRMKPPLLRKKSGELVKPALRPSSRRRPSSMPGTPTYSKAVHFNEDMEQVRHFLSLDRPMAVSAGSSPVETHDDDTEYPFGYDDGYRSTAVEWEIKLANFPGDTYERKIAPVRMERIFLAPDNKTLVGTIAVANIAFHKLVVARFTLDYWKTTSEVVAEYNHDVRKKQSNDGYDRFNFNIRLADQANLATKTLLLCVRYQVNGQEFWDNNNSMNYQVDFTKKIKQKTKGTSGPLGAIPRSRKSPPAPRPRSMPVGSFDEDFDGFESRYEFGSGRGFFADSPNPSLRLKPKPKRGNPVLNGASSLGNPSGHFSNRYDFSASLTAALSNAQNAMGDRSGVKKKTEQVQVAQPNNSTATKDNLASEKKPDLQSAEYNELIQKFCFFGTSAKGSPKVSSPPAKSSIADGTTEYMSSSNSGSNPSSASNSPPSPAMGGLVDGANDARTISGSPNHFLSRSTSPGPFTGSGPENRMTPSFQYGYNRHNDSFPEPGQVRQTCV